MFRQNSAILRGITQAARAQDVPSSGTRARRVRERISIHPEKLEPRVHLSYDSRGKVAVIVDNTVAPSLVAELAQFKQDLIGDGWTVSMHTDAPRMNDNANVFDNSENPPLRVDDTTEPYRHDIQTVKDMIADDADDETLKAIVIIGHVTVPYSGLTKYDGHGEGRAMPTDQYYADLDGTPTTWGDSSVDAPAPSDSATIQWTPNTPGDGRFDANFVPSDGPGGLGDGLELSFGRIDMANLEQCVLVSSAIA